MVLNNLISDHVNPNAEVIMKLMLVERTLKTALDEIDEIKLSISTQLPSTIS